MISHRAARLALRAKLASLVVCTTGSTTLSATSTGFTRSAGSFVTDGFAVGMWFERTGFATNTPGVITSVSALAMGVTLYSITYPGGVQTVSSPSMAVESAAAGRTLTVGLPALREWENVKFTPVAGVPSVREEYVPGPSKRIAGGIVEWLPEYFPQIEVQSGIGVGAADAYADALLQLFAPGTPFTLTNATMRVRGDHAPYSGQLLQSSPGFARVPVTIPLLLRTRNP